MINILMTKDCSGWAISNLAESIMKHNKHYNFIDIPVHPRDVNSSLMDINMYLQDNQIDLWHAQYWNSAVQLLDILGGMEKVPSVLSHHNHYALEKDDWRKFNFVTIPTEYGFEKLDGKCNNLCKIPYGLDLKRFSYIEDYNPEKNTIGYIGRVIPHKNLAKIVEGAKKHGYKVIGSGYIDKPNYWEEVDKNEMLLEFNGGIGRNNMMPADFKDSIYERMSIFCMYSTGNKETGTLPLLEAAARGVPILCTNEGMARDLFKDGESCIKFNEKNFEEKLKMIMEDKELRLKIRENAFKVMLNYTEQIMARRYDRLYQDAMNPNIDMVSVVVPTYNRSDTLLKNLVAINANNYPKKEIIVVDDNSDDDTRMIVSECRKRFKTPIKYHKTDSDGYGLAKARNIGILESVGDIILFLDDRLAIRENVIEEVAKTKVPGSWCFGQKVVKNKPSGKRGFVENFSWILREDITRSGMFCERMEYYGGMSQEIRYRFTQQGYGFNYCPDVMADEIVSSRSKSKRKKDIWKAKLLLKKLYG